MRLLVIVDSVPNVHHGGGGITAYAAVIAMRQRGHQVKVLALSPDTHRHGKSDQDHILHLRRQGIEVEVLTPSNQAPKVSLVRKVLPELEDVFPAYRQRQDVAHAIQEHNADAVFMYHWNALAAAHGIHSAPKLGVVGDPAHLPFLFRKELLKRQGAHPASIASLKSVLLEKTRISRMRRWMTELLQDCDSSGAFAAHHAAEFAASGVKNCNYFHTPTPDPLLTRRKGSKPNKLKILHIGHLQGIATLSGIELLAQEIIPMLSQELGPEGFEVHIVGGYHDSVPTRLKKLLEHPAVHIRGQISPPDDEFLSSHVVLVPTPIELGIRVRIITALSFGACTVAHEANAKGIPELSDGTNCLLGSDAASLTRACLAAFRDVELRSRLEAGARKTYEEYFSLETAGSEIFNRLSAVTRKGPVQIGGPPETV